MENIHKSSLAELVNRKNLKTADEKNWAPISEDPAPGTAFFQSLPPDALADYILEQHHNYTKKMLPLLATYAQNVAERHGESYPSLWDIDILLTELMGEMSEHMLKEEQILFPYIHRLTNAQKTGNLSEIPVQPFVESPIQVMEMEHDHAGEMMRQIRRLTNDFTPPLAASTTWRLAFSELSEFERNLQQHFHLENTLLFPAAKALEASLLKQAA